jgi:hypothetical protein
MAAAPPELDKSAQAIPTGKRKYKILFIKVGYIG